MLKKPNITCNFAVKCFYYTALNRSSEFASRPGVCPEEEMDSLNYSCTLDTDCPGLKKCCNSSKGAGCVDPIPEGMLLTNSQLPPKEVSLTFSAEDEDKQSNCYCVSS